MEGQPRGDGHLRRPTSRYGGAGRARAQAIDPTDCYAAVTPATAALWQHVAHSPENLLKYARNGYPECCGRPWGILLCKYQPRRSPSTRLPLSTGSSKDC